MAGGILVPRPRIKPTPPAVEVQSLNHWTTREVPNVLLFLFFNILKLSFILAVVSLDCGAWDLQSLLQHVGSSCGTWDL